MILFLEIEEDRFMLQGSLKWTVWFWISLCKESWWCCWSFSLGSNIMLCFGIFCEQKNPGDGLCPLENNLHREVMSTSREGLGIKENLFIKLNDYGLETKPNHLLGNASKFLSVLDVACHAWKPYWLGVQRFRRPWQISFKRTLPFDLNPTSKIRKEQRERFVKETTKPTAYLIVTMILLWQTDFRNLNSEGVGRNMSVIWTALSS